MKRCYTRSSSWSICLCLWACGCGAGGDPGVIEYRDLEGRAAACAPASHESKIADSESCSEVRSEIRALLPAYYDFLQALRRGGYAFMDFATYWGAEKESLPEKLLVVRHDVHARDIVATYDMRRIERFLLPPRSATYFVMLSFPPEAEDEIAQRDYLNAIQWLATQKVDVQPHISPNDMYISTYEPAWSSYSAKELKKLTKDEYTIEEHDDGVDIVAIPDDVLDLRRMNERLLGLLSDYNHDWQQETGLEVRYYAAHGSHLAVNRVMNNATLLDQRALLGSGVYEFDTYNTQVHRYIGDLSDNEEPPWMDHPETIEPGRYELLAHPYFWQPEQTEKRLAKAAAAEQ